MPDVSKFLITGATGQVGRGVIEFLRGRENIEIISAVRVPKKATDLGCPIRELDLDKPETFNFALAGINCLFLMTGYTVDMLRQSKVFLDAAKKAGVRHVVHLGACGDDQATVGHWVWHQLVERYIEWGGFSFTHIRPEQFMQNLLGYSGKPTIINGVIEQCFGDARLSWVDCEDVAAVCALSLIEIEKHAGKVYRMGYDAQSLHDVAEILTRVIGKPFLYQAQSPDKFLAKVLADGAEPAYMKCVRDHYVAYAEGKIPRPDQVFDNFEAIVGRKPVSWEDFAKKHKQTFEEGFG
jgi:NAD(P)H dehydrogenase (quinone)